MKKFKVVFLLSIMFFSLGSCETVDFGDMNENTNGPSEFDTAALLTAAQRRYSVIGFRTWLANPHLYVQYQSQPVYQDPSRYAETPTDWSAYYVQTLQNLQTIIEIANDPDRNTTPAFLANGSAENQIAVAKIMKVIIFRRLTDTYGDIPYFEALNPEIQSPAYTPQREIYLDFVSELQEAREMLDPAQDGPAGDIVYNGNVNKWQKLANSLLLSISLQMSETDLADTAQSVFVEALNNEHGVIETVAEEAWYQPINVSTLVNPWTDFRPADYNMSEYFQNALQGDEDDYSNDVFDSRLLIYSSAPMEEGLPYGLADYGDLGSNARISAYITSPISPLPWFTSAYTYLNRAEAAARGWTTEDAMAMLEMGIIQSYQSTTEKFGMGPHTTVGTGSLEPIDITDEAEEFAASRLADAAATGIMQVIGEEKWAALFPQGFLAWNEWRRLDYPILTPSPDPLNDGAIPTRYLYPNTEINLNNTNYSAAVGRLTPAADKNTSRVWWDVD